MLDLITAAMRRKRPATHGLLDTFSAEFRVGLFDIDINMHLNNSKYLKYMDRCRLQHAVATGMLDKLIKARCIPVMANTEIAYIRELRPYQHFSVDSRILGWDNKYIYLDQRFMSRNKLHTHALLRMVYMHEGKTISPQAMQEITDLNMQSPALPEYVEQWKLLLQSKKRYTDR